MILRSTLLSLALFSISIRANTEKVIFLGPERVQIPKDRPDFYDLNLEVLSPSKRSVRKQLPVVFPRQGQEQGLQTWYLLDDLEPGHRYEVRVCWAAIEPTQFWLYAYPIAEVFEKPSLISALAYFSESRLRHRPVFELESSRTSTSPPEPQTKSLVFLQLFAAADFYTTNSTLMSDPPAVHVDLIFDPFLLNLLPESLLPTAVYILLLFIGSWYISALVWRWLHNFDQDAKFHTE